MKFLKKLKNIFKPRNQPTNSPNPALPTHHYPVTQRVMTWLDTQDWRYEHKKSEHDSRTHHLIMSFTDNSSDWTCVFRINERTQMLSIYGILPDIIPLSHYAPMLTKIAYANLNIGFGNIELDPTDGEVRVKMSVDAEFSPLNDRALGCYLQGVASLTELAQKMFDEVMTELEPSPLVHDYLETPEYEADAQTDSDFFMPTQQAQ